MTFYVTPFGRSTRQAWARPNRDEEYNDVACDVLVPVNVRAEADDFVITALLPGVKADDLSIQVVNETITLQGEIKADAEAKSPYMVQECPTGRFYRVIRLPEPLNSQKANASLDDGVLTLRVPKAEEARPKTIKVISKN